MAYTPPVPRASNLRNLVKARQNEIERGETITTIAQLLGAEVRKREATVRINKYAEAEKIRLANIMQDARDTNRVPVMLGDLLGPDGNVFNIIGACRQGIKWAEKHGLPVSTKAVDVCNGFMDRSYGETLMLISMYYLDINNSIALLQAWKDAREIDPEIGNGPPRVWTGRPLADT